MKLIAYLPNAEIKDATTAQQWFSHFNLKVQLADLNTNRLSTFTAQGATILVFGSLPKQFEGRVERPILLPDIKELEPKPENAKHRALMIKALTQLSEEIEELVEKEIIDTKKIRAEDLPDAEAKHLLLLKETIDNLEKKSFFLKAQNGRLVEINSTGQPTNQQVDLAMSFEELYTIRLAMDVLGKREVSIVSTGNKSSD